MESRNVLFSHLKDKKKCSEVSGLKRLAHKRCCAEKKRKKKRPGAASKNPVNAGHGRLRRLQTESEFGDAFCGSLPHGEVEPAAVGVY